MSGNELRIGWREWVQLSALGIPAIKAKIDTGAKTSALHAFQVTTEKASDGEEIVRFLIHPIRNHNEFVVECEAKVHERRVVRDSGGHEEERIVIQTPITLGGQEILSDVTLTSRDDMLFRMLIGRRTIESAEALVSVRDSYLLGKLGKTEYSRLYSSQA